MICFREIGMHLKINCVIVFFLVAPKIICIAFQTSAVKSTTLSFILVGENELNV